MIISIDPGISAGIAFWLPNGRLIRAGLLRGGLSRDRADGAWPGHPCTWAAITNVVVERPQIYRHSKADPNDLITLAMAAGELIGRILAEHPGSEVLECLPATWKGQVPKDIMVERIKKGLSEAEHKRVILPTAASLAHNVWDAVGIGLYHLRGGTQTSSAGDIVRSGGLQIN